MSEAAFERKRWLLFAIISVLLFFITASTFTSLGVVLPYMVDEMKWNWTTAGAGFSLLALLVGLAGAVPAWTLRRYGAKVTFALGGAIMASGFGVLALTGALYEYFIGTAFLGLGYPLFATVPGVYIVNNWMPDRRSFAIGAYMMIGGLGGLAGPLFVNTIVTTTESWRLHWWVMTLLTLLIAVIAVIFVEDRPEEKTVSGDTAARVEENYAEGIYKTEQDWQFPDVIRTPQYHIIVWAMTITLLCGLTLNSAAFQHMTSLGVAGAFAAGALSAHGGLNALSRALGGVLATRIDPKWLMVSALISEVIGMLALAVADNPIAITLMVLGEGYGFGMSYFATAILLVNYFGTADNPRIFGTMHVITTFAMLGPLIAGVFYDRFGSFAPVFRGYAVILVLIIIASVMMRPPHIGPREKNSITPP